MKNILLILAIIFLQLNIYGQYGDTFNWDTITFEESLPWYFSNDTSSQNIWQIGTPQKAIFDSAWSAPNSIVTDTINNYPVNNHSWFEIKIGAFNYLDWWYPWSIFMELNHKYDTDTLKDGGYITVSWDDGVTWENIIKDNVYQEMTPEGANENLYNWYSDSLYNGEFGFSGNSAGWITTWYAWHYLPVRAVELSDTMLVRFNFISDTIETNNEGWLIDDIRLYSRDIQGVVEEHKNVHFSLYPNPINHTSTIEFKSFNHKVELEVFNNLGQRVFYRDYYNTQSILFSRKDLKPGVYILKMKTPEWEESMKILIE